MLDFASPFGDVPYTPFDLDLDAISRDAFGKSNVYLMVNGLAVIPSLHAAKPFDAVDEDGRRRTLGGASADLQRTDFALGSQALTVIKDRSATCREPRHGSVHHATFARALVDFEVCAIAAYLKVLMSYSESRLVGSQRLARVPSQRIRLALVMEKLLMLRVALEQLSWGEDPQARMEVAEAVYACMDALIKSAGGRSLLTGGLVQMHAALHLVNQIYLGGDYA
ncbi:hypothetical protein WJ41_13775 [Burkholderia ubonensis]|uniref:hypothetical protein n=1 Tax=Burkholderia ubonensis TaxID=101571 RepID=UPI00075C45C4|nr:hypothetical protein [Burkholderia ubonensis]KVH72197.1 hypothetical protein WJ41_13775 [Burkholderia ubonensis]KVU04715.1 hypothetical protein WK61_02335 [Burkholderia ubonensis]